MLPPSCQSSQFPPSSPSCLTSAGLSLPLDGDDVFSPEEASSTVKPAGFIVDWACILQRPKPAKKDMYLSQLGLHSTTTRNSRKLAPTWPPYCRVNVVATSEVMSKTHLVKGQQDAMIPKFVLFVLLNFNNMPSTEFNSVVSRSH